MGSEKIESIINLYMGSLLIKTTLNRKMKSTSQINPVTFMASANGQSIRKSWVEKFQGAILTIATTALIGNFTFLWKLNALVTRLEDHDVQKTNDINNINGKINTMQLNMQDIRESVIRIEAKQKH